MNKILILLLLLTSCASKKPVKVGLCPTVRVEDTTKTWNEVDVKRMKIAQKRCSVLYKNHPCLVYFLKKGTNNYWALCGKKYEY